MTAPARFTKADISRALKAADDAGVNVRIEIEPNGKIVILTQAQPATAMARNPWDQDL